MKRKYLKEGLNRLLDFAFEQHSVRGKIVCPCHSWKFKKWLTRGEAYDHLTWKLFPFDYIKWAWHGECNTPSTSTCTTNLIENFKTP